MVSKTFNISRMKKNMVLITMNKNEVYDTIKYTFTVNNAFSVYKHMKEANAVSSSVDVILLIVSHKKDKQVAQDDSRITWGKLIKEMTNVSKPNVLDFTTMNHHDSKIFYYSFGNKGIFKKVRNCTMGQCLLKNKCNGSKEEEVESIAEEVEIVVDVKLSSGVQYLSIVIPNLSFFIAPILNVENTL